jgi:hypothetical protein
MCNLCMMRVVISSYTCNLLFINLQLATWSSYTCNLLSWACCIYYMLCTLSSVLCVECCVLFCELKTLLLSAIHHPCSMHVWHKCMWHVTLWHVCFMSWLASHKLPTAIQYANCKACSCHHILACGMHTCTTPHRQPTPPHYFQRAMCCAAVLLCCAARYLFMISECSLIANYYLLTLHKQIASFAYLTAVTCMCNLCLVYDASCNIK